VSDIGVNENATRCRKPKFFGIEIVPIQVSYHDFWLRYFYRVWKIDQEDEKRRQIVQGKQAPTWMNHRSPFL
jgi:hypothetical protein